MWYIGSDTGSTYYIAHHGILGQKWGIRRYQNKDGTLTPEGKARAHQGLDSIDKIVAKGNSKAEGIRMRGNMTKAMAPFTGAVAGMAGGAALGGPVGMGIGSVAGGLTGAGLGAIHAKRAYVKAADVQRKYHRLGKKMAEELGETIATNLLEDPEYKKYLANYYKKNKK